MRLREEHRARAEMVAADLRLRDRFGAAHVGVADDRQVLAERLERAQRARRQVERRARSSAGDHRFCVAPQSVLPAAPCTISMQTSRVRSSAAAPAVFDQRRARRHHGIEKRQRHRRAQPPQHRPPRNVLSGDECIVVSCYSVVRAGRLLAWSMPTAVGTTRLRRSSSGTPGSSRCPARTPTADRRSPAASRTMRAHRRHVGVPERAGPARRSSGSR